MTLVFNELSAESRAPTRNEAMERMNHLVKAIVAFAGDRDPKLLAVDSTDFFGIPLTDDYTLGAWLRDPAADRDQRLFLLAISTKTTIDREVSDAAKDRFLLSDFRVQDKEALGLGLSYLMGTVAVSLRSCEYWMTVRVPMQHSWLEADESEHCMDVVALNIADHSQVNTVTDDLLTRAWRELSGAPRSLVGRFRECFPHLRFGLDVERQLSVLPGDLLEATAAKLIVLDGAV